MELNFTIFHHFQAEIPKSIPLSPLPPSSCNNCNNLASAASLAVCTTSAAVAASDASSKSASSASLALKIDARGIHGKQTCDVNCKTRDEMLYVAFSGCR